MELLSEELSEEDAAERLTMTVTEVEAVPLETTTEVAPVATPVMTPEPLTWRCSCRALEGQALAGGGRRHLAGDGLGGARL